MREAEQIWNRVGWDGNGWTATRPGDRALADMLRADNETFHGGIPNVLESLSDAELDAAIDGFRYFDLSGAAEVIEEARRCWRDDLDETEAEHLEHELNERYWTMTPDGPHCSLPSYGATRRIQEHSLRSKRGLGDGLVEVDRQNAA